MEKIIRQFGQIRKSEDDNRTVKFTFSTSAKDRHHTILNKDGWQLDNFNANGIAGYMHDVYGDGLLAKPDPDDVIGKARAWVEGDNLVGEITFEPPDLNEKADKIYRKVQFGSLNAVSVGFLETGKGRMGDKEEGEDPGAYYFEGQELLEISVVNIPSNPEALKNRDFIPFNENYKPDLTTEVTNSDNMEKEEKKDLAPETSKVEEKVIKPDTTEFNEVVAKAIDSLGEKLKTWKETPIPGAPETGEAKEKEDLKKRYSMREAILKFSNPREQFDGVYKEMHEEAVRENARAKIPGGSQVDGRSFMVPSMIHSPEKRATLQATVSAAGGYGVSTDMLGLIETLRNKMVIMQAGAKLLPGLEGNIAIPRRSADSTAYWRSEGGVATQSDPTYEQVTLEPHRLNAFTRFSRQFLRQSSFAVEQEVNDVLLYAMKNELEQTAFDGSGSSNQPEGIFNNSSVNNADHGSNGTAMTSSTAWTNVVGLEKMVAADNALGGKLAYITNSTMGAHLKTTTKTSYQGGFIWESFTPLGGQGMINGYPAYISNVLSAALTKGTGTGLSPIVFGNWEELLLGQWGALEFIVDPYTRATYDEINVVVVGYFDYALRHPQSFATIEAGEVS